MKKEKKIQDSNWIYNSLLGYVNSSFRHAYSKVEYIGMENIPEDSAVIFAPNHTNALMDALAVLAIDNRRKVFVARADIFKNPTQARLLHFLKIMPIMRVRDGLDEVRKNDETIEKAIDVLKDGVPFCILPEGRHRPKHSLLPLCKGIFRIALSAEEALSSKDIPLYIVPIGIEYGNFFRFRSSILVQIGKPIDVAPYTRELDEKTYPQVMNEMRDDLTAAMRQLILDIPDDDRYDLTYEICAAVSDWQIRRSKLRLKKHSLLALFQASRKTIAEIGRAREEKPEKMEQVFALAEEARALRLASHVSLNTVVSQRAYPYRWWKLVPLVLTLPFTLPASLLTLPITGISTLIFRKMKDRTFYNSVRYAVTLFIWPLLWILYSVLGYCFLPWQLVLPVTLALLPATMIAQDLYKTFRLMGSEIRWMKNRRLRQLYNQLHETYHEIL